MKQIETREGARRQHRAIAVFAVIQSWLRGLDGLVFERDQLLRLLGLERVKLTRVSWLKEDFQDFFPFQQDVYLAGKLNAAGSLNSLAGFWVSRKELAPYFPQGTMGDAERLGRMPKDGPRMGMFKMWPLPNSTFAYSWYAALVPFLANEGNFDERLLSSYLLLLSQGQISPRLLASMTDAEWQLPPLIAKANR